MFELDVQVMQLRVEALRRIRRILGCLSLVKQSDGLGNFGSSLVNQFGGRCELVASPEPLGDR